MVLVGAAGRCDGFGRCEGGGNLAGSSLWTNCMVVFRHAPDHFRRTLSSLEQFCVRFLCSATGRVGSC